MVQQKQNKSKARLRVAPYTVFLSVLLSLLVVLGVVYIACRIQVATELKPPRVLSSHAQVQLDNQATEQTMLYILSSADRDDAASENASIADAESAALLSDSLRRENLADQAEQEYIEISKRLDAEKQQADLQASLDAKAEEEIRAMGGVEATNDYEIFISDDELHTPSTPGVPDTPEDDTDLDPPIQVEVEEIPSPY